MFPFEVDSTTDVPLWVQLRQRLVYLINSGYFKPGDQLPTVRGLASEISINYNTVNKAYLSLVSDGYLESTRGRGVFVRDLDAEMDQDDDGAAITAITGLRVVLAPPAAREFTRRSLALVAQGRRPCPLCNEPLDPRGHVCPRANGYRRR